MNIEIDKVRVTPLGKEPATVTVRIDGKFQIIGLDENDVIEIKELLKILVAKKIA